MDVALVERMRDALDRGQARSAHDLGAATAPLVAWRGAAARDVAGRIAHHLGGWRLSVVLAACAYREHRDDADAVRGWASERLYANDPARALALLDHHEALLADAPAAVRARWHSTRAGALSWLRDWARADDALAQAFDADPDSLWVAVDSAQMLEQRDDLDGALERIADVRQRAPGYLPAARVQARLFEGRGDGEAALAVLRQAAESAQSVPLLRHLLALEVESGDFERAEQTADRADALAFLADDTHRQAIAAERFDIARGRLDRTEAIRWARANGSGFHLGIAERLEAEPDAPMTQPMVLPVPFVRQNYMTCGPATLDALCQFFGRDAAQAEIIEAIWFDGTSEYSERQWAIDQGLVAREFRLDWETALALIDREVPFTLQTVEVSSAHLQAVIGYDRACGTLIIRDPTRSTRSEWRAEAGLAWYASSGPRAMVVLPADKAHRLDALELPEAALYDQLHALRAALDGHDRAGAEAALATLQGTDPDARLTRFAEYALAVYDNDSPRALAVNELLMARYPDDRRLKGRHQHWLGALGRTRERREALVNAARAPDADASVLGDAMLALQGDQRTRHERRRLLKRLRRAAPLDPETFLVIAMERWEEHAFDDALACYRVAACLGDLQPRYVRSFIQAAGLRNRVAEAEAFLEDRVRRFGHLSAQPARLLMDLLEGQGRLADAERVAAAALERHPDDGELLLAGAHLLVRLGNPAEAGEFVERARASTHAADWARAAAGIAEAADDGPVALDHLLEACRLEPLDVASVGRATTLIARLRGHREALDWLAGCQGRFPEHYGLASLRVEWLRDHDAAAQDDALASLLEHHPDDGWALREHALAALRAGDGDAALARTARALAVAPRSAVNHVVQAHVLARLGDPSRAREAYARAVALDVDNADAVRGLFMQSVGTPELTDAAERCARAFAEQVIQGESLETFGDEARRTLGAAAAEDVLREAHARRADLWQTWTALARHHLHVDAVDDASRVLREATERFPYAVDVWIARAAAEQAGGDVEGQRDALRRALGVEPGHAGAVRALITSFEHTGDFTAAAEVAKDALVRDPFDAYALATVAEDAWRRGDRTAALDSMSRAVEHSPDWSWAWDKLRAWSESEGCSERVGEALDRLKRKYPGDARNHVVEARMAPSAQAALLAWEAALSAEPGNETAVLGRIETLESLGRADEALAVADDPRWAGRAPDSVRLALLRLRWRNGQVDAALDQLTAWLDEAPGHVEAWATLADFHDELGNDEAYLDAANRLVALAPAQPRSHAWVGHALARLERPAPALAAYERATELQPDYLFAQDGRFIVALELEDYATAENALEALVAHATPLQAGRRVLRLALLKQDEPRAEEALRAIARDPAATDSDVGDAWDAVTEGYDGARCRQLLEDMLDEPGAAAAVGNMWVRSLGPASAIRSQVDRIDGLLARGPAGSGALAAYFSALGEAGDPAWLDEAVSRWGDTIATDRRAWIALVETLDRRRLMGPAHRWASTWRDYPQAGPTDLLTVAVTLLGATDVDEALVVSARSLDLVPDGFAAWHHCLQAACHAMKGDVESARAALLAAQGEELGDYFEALRALTGALVLAEGQGPAQPRDVLGALARAGRARRIGDPLHDRLWTLDLRAAAAALHPGLPGWVASGLLRLRLLLGRGR